MWIFGFHWFVPPYGYGPPSPGWIKLIGFPISSRFTLTLISGDPLLYEFGSTHNA